MTIFKNLLSINNFKKRKKKILYRSLFLRSQKVKPLPTLAINDARKIEKKYGYRIKIQKTKQLLCNPTWEDKIKLLENKLIESTLKEILRSPLSASTFFTWMEKVRKIKIKIKESKQLASASTRKDAFPKNELLENKIKEKKKKLFFTVNDGSPLFTMAKKRVVTSKQLLLAKKAEYRKYNKKKRLPKLKIPVIIPEGAKIGRITIKSSYNNVILTLTDKEGKTKAWASAGTAGFQNGRKSSDIAAESAADRLANRSITLGYTFARLKIKGMGSSKKKAIRRLCKSNLQLLGMSEDLLIPYNGCRRARKPRK